MQIMKHSGCNFKTCPKITLAGNKGKYKRKMKKRQ